MYLEGNNYPWSIEICVITIMTQVNCIYDFYRCMLFLSSFFQSLCVLGYCILPLTVAMLVCRLVLLATPGPINFMVRLFVVIVMFAWSIVGKNIVIFIITEQTKACVRDEDQTTSSVTPDSRVSNVILASVAHRILCSKWD